MMKTIKSILLSLLKDEDGTYSGMKVTSGICLFVFLIVSCYLAYNNITWGNYEAFSTATGLGGLGLRGVNKFLKGKQYQGGEQ